MPLHPCFADKLHLLEGMASIEAALADPDQASRRTGPSPHPTRTFGTMRPSALTGRYRYASTPLWTAAQLTGRH